MPRMSVRDFPADRESGGKIKKDGMVTFPNAAKCQKYHGPKRILKIKSIKKSPVHGFSWVEVESRSQGANIFNSKWVMKN